MARIIVLSDLHYSKSNHDDVYDADQISDSVVYDISEDYYEQLFCALEGEKEPADLFIFCGDFINGGNTEADKKKSFDSFVEFLHKIENSKKILQGDEREKHIVVVPGNHDILRGRKSIYKEFKNRLNKYLTPFSDRLEQIDSPTFVFDDLRIIIDCETTSNNSSTTNSKIKQWIKMVENSSATSAQKEELLAEMMSESIVDIPSISAASRSRFIKTAKQHLDNEKYKDYLKLMVTHHPLLSGVESGKTVKSYNYTVGGYSFMRSAMELGYSLFIHGHIHEKSCIEITDYGQESPCTAVQLGIPSMGRRLTERGIFVVDTKGSINGRWPFSVVYKTLSSYTLEFKQAAVLVGNRIENKSEKAEMTILVDKEITELIDVGKVIKNGDRDRVEAASYDCALGCEYKRSKSRYCDWNKIKASYLEISNRPAEIVIEPQESVLIYTDEEFDVPHNMVMHASPISSWLRKGLRVEISFFVDPGFQGRFCFPVINESAEPVHISAREPIMSIEFVQLSVSCQKSWTERHRDIAEKRIKQED